MYANAQKAARANGTIGQGSRSSGLVLVELDFETRKNAGVNTSAHKRLFQNCRYGS